MRLIAVGDNVTDCYLDEGVYYPGGNAVNVAVNCKRNGAEAVNYIGVFGDDERADYIRSCMLEEGVTSSRSRKVYAPTAQPGVRINEEGDRIFVGGQRDTCQHLFSIKLTREDLALIETFDICHTSCYSNLEYELETLSRVCAVSFDFSDRRDHEYLKRVCPYVTYAFFSGSDLSEEEVRALLEEAAGLGAKIVGVTRGSKGSLFYDGVQYYEQGICKVQTVDAMGAGDSFIAGFLTHFADHKNMKGPAICGGACSEYLHLRRRLGTSP